MSDIWFTSDTHFDHANVIKYCNRPFRHVDEMNNTMIQNWNSVVKRDDTIYHLGDFAFSKDPGKFFHRLNGNKILILGNHDRQVTKHLPWGSYHSYYETKIDGQFIVLCHYAFKVFNKHHHGAWNFYGHSHNSLGGNSQQLDVGVDAWSFFPVNLEQIAERLKTLPPFRSQDGHK